MAHKTYNYRWWMLRRDLNWIAKDIQRRGIADAAIIAPIRGGLIPATMLSHKTGFPVKTCQFQRLDGQDKEPVVYGLDKSYTTLIIIDDIMDTGKTLREIDRNLSEVSPLSRRLMYSLVGREHFTPMTNVICARRFGRGWVNFCWEKK